MWNNYGKRVSYKERFLEEFLVLLANTTQKKFKITLNNFQNMENLNFRMRG